MCVPSRPWSSVGWGLLSGGCREAQQHKRAGQDERRPHGFHGIPPSKDPTVWILVCADSATAADPDSKALANPSLIHDTSFDPPSCGLFMRRQQTEMTQVKCRDSNGPSRLTSIADRGPWQPTSAGRRRLPQSSTPLRIVAPTGQGCPIADRSRWLDHVMSGLRPDRRACYSGVALGRAGRALLTPGMANGYRRCALSNLSVRATTTRCAPRYRRSPAATGRVPGSARACPRPRCRPHPTR